MSIKNIKVASVWIDEADREIPPVESPKKKVSAHDLALKKVFWASRRLKELK